VDKRERLSGYRPKLWYEAALGLVGGLAVETAFIINHWQKRPGTVEHDVRRAIEIPGALAIGFAATSTIVGVARYLHARRHISTEDIDSASGYQHDGNQSDQSLGAHKGLGEVG
jgi:hypothetical protein